MAEACLLIFPKLLLTLIISKCSEIVPMGLCLPATWKLTKTCKLSMSVHPDSRNGQAGGHSVFLY